MDRLEGIVNELREFVREREWEQFHDPKNLAMAIVSEAGELASEYRWVPNDQADLWSAEPENRSRVEAEAGDVGIALLLYADRVGFDLVTAIRRKIEINRTNYPVKAVQGRSERPGRG